MSEINREEWLNMGADALRGLFTEHSHTIPEQVRITCGFPSRAAMARKNQRIGECWSSEASADSTFEIFISPVLDNPVKVMATLAHELVHAAVGLKAAHGKAFKRCAVAIGLEGKMTATKASKAFEAWLAPVLVRIGDYPHARLNASKESSDKKQGTRMLKCECMTCGYVVRTTAKWLEQGTPLCQCNSKPMQSNQED